MKFEVEGHEIESEPSKSDVVRYFGMMSRLPDGEAFAVAKWEADCAWLREVVTPSELVDELHPVTVAALVTELIAPPDGKTVGKSAITRKS
jgi:hypothetical protein